MRLLKLGTAKATITPPIGTMLAGFGHRDHGAEAVLDDLETQVLWFQSGDAPQQAVCMVTADIIGFDAALEHDLRNTISTAHGIKAEHILLAASHTHSGPQTCANMLGVGVPAPEVIGALRQRILDATHAARGNLRPVILSAGRGRCEGYAVNRRVIIDGKATFSPNPAGVRDDDVSVMACHHSETGELVAALFHFTCHPTTLGDYRITADYPGVARRYIEHAHRGATVAFLQGCCGDVRPSCTYMGAQQFRTGQPQDVAAFGTALGDTVVNILNGPLQPLTAELGGRMTTVELPLSHQPSRDKLAQIADTGSPLEKQWSARLLAEPPSPTRPFSVQRIDLAAELSLIALGGEVCCDYGHFVKQMTPDRLILPVSYANGLTGYIPSARMFPEGGYEVDSSGLYYGLPAPFEPSIEALIHAAIGGLMAPATVLG
jgi:hypothetical protein